jgi:hypothetical protein
MTEPEKILWQVEAVFGVWADTAEEAEQLVQEDLDGCEQPGQVWGITKRGDY